MTSAQLPAVIDPSRAEAPPPQWTEFSREQKVAFLEALADRGDVRAAARAAGISHHTAYRARRADAAFREAWTGALLAARPASVEVLATRAIDGVEEEIRYRGEVVGTRRRYSDRLLLAHLGRLDQLTQDARASAFADDFEAALTRFAEGKAQPESAPDPAEGCSSPEQCRSRLKSNSFAELEAAREMRAERLARQMEAARPDYGPTPRDFEEKGYAWVEVHAEQLRAFEDGIEDWWIVVPGEDPNALEYTFL